MARKGRVILITLGVIVALVVVLALAVRLFLTREKLIAMIVPRIEKAVDARVTIGDIGINFPFGFGVDVEELSFEKTLPDTSVLTFSSEAVTARASLISLLKRKPEITAIDVRGGTVTLLSLAKGREVTLRGIKAHGKMSSREAGFSGSVRALIDSLLVSAPGRPPAITLEKISLDGKVRTDPEFTRLAIEDAKIVWSDLLAAEVKGEVTNMKTAPRLALSIEGDERPLAPVIAKVMEFKLDELSPANTTAPKSAAPTALPQMSRGTFKFDAALEGLAREPLALDISFEGGIRDLAVRAGETMSIEKAKADFKGRGPLLAWQGLFPSSSKPATPAEISVAWRAVRLDGEIELEGGEFLVPAKSAGAGAAVASTEGGAGGAAPSSAEKPESTGRTDAAPLRVSALTIKAEFSGPDVTKLSGEFMIGSSPYKFKGSLLNIMPASAELLLIARDFRAAGEKSAADIGPILDAMVNKPIITVEVDGRSFDARPYQKPKSAAKAAAPA